MPFNLFGEFIPEDDAIEPKKSSRPIKIFTEKRKNSFVTIIKNLPCSENDTKELLSFIKKKLGCGGSIKEGQLEIQGKKIEQIKTLLKEKGL